MDLAWWLPAKDAIVAFTGLERDALHIYFGVAIVLLTAPFLADGLRDRRVLLPLVLATLANEALDIAYDRWPADARWEQYAASAHDLFNSLALPLLLTIIARRLYAHGIQSAKPIDAVPLDQALNNVPPRD